MKLYTNDPDVRYTNTTVNPQRTKAEIDGLLARWGIKKVAWEWDIENNKVVLQFQLNEKFRGREINPVVRLTPPVIWRKGNPRARDPDRRLEKIDWRVSMRILHWYIKSNLEMAYSMQSEKTLAFLPHVAVSEETTVKDVVVPRLEEMKQWKKALPVAKPEDEESRDPRVIDVSSE